MFDFFKEETDLTVGVEATQSFCYTAKLDADSAQLIVCDPDGRVVDACFMRKWDELEVSFVPYMTGQYKIFETKFGHVKYLNCYE